MSSSKSGSKLYVDMLMMRRIIWTMNHTNDTQRQKKYIPANVPPHRYTYLLLWLCSCHVLFSIPVDSVHEVGIQFVDSQYLMGILGTCMLREEKKSTQCNQSANKPREALLLSSSSTASHMQNNWMCYFRNVEN